MNRKQKIVVGLAVVAGLLILADYKSAAVWRLFGWEEVDKTPADLDRHLIELGVIAISCVGLLYLLRSKVSSVDGEG